MKTARTTPQIIVAARPSTIAATLPRIVIATPLLAVLLLAVLLPAACTPAPRAATYLAEYVALAGPGVDTTAIFPGPETQRHAAGLPAPPADATAIFPGPDARRHLVGLPAPPADATLLWVTGTSLQLRFYAVTDSPRTLWVEARPATAPGGPGQTIAAMLRDTTWDAQAGDAQAGSVHARESHEIDARASEPVDSPALAGRSTGAAPDSAADAREMEPGWGIYEFPLPAGAIRRGWNLLELRFARTIRPADYDPASTDERELAACLRRIEIRPDGHTRPSDADRRIEVDFGDGDGDGDGAPALVGDAVRDPAAATIDMPAGSMAELFLLPRRDTELLAELSATPGPPGGELAVEIEIVDERGEAVDAGATTIWRGTPSDAWWGSVPVRADLGEWAGHLVALRIRVAGAGRGAVRFTGLRTRSATTAFDERFGIPEAVPADARARPERPPDIFVVLLDAARADALFRQRGGRIAPDVRELAPNIRELAAHATTFLQAWSPAAWTGQAVPAVLTGLSPDTLGFTSWESRLPAGFDTLPGLLRGAGYYTFLFSQHTFYDPQDELLEGFDRAETVLIRDRLPDPAHLVDDQRPTFALIHLLPPHDPYDAPEPFAGTRSAWYDGDVDLDLDLLRGFFDLVPAAEQDEVRRLAIARYEENVAHADDLVGRLIARLRELGRYDDAIVVLLSDHGEAFGEHGAFLHGGQVFEEAIHVPLLIKPPGGRDAFPGGRAGALARAPAGAPGASAGAPAGARGSAPAAVDTPVSTLDLAPTLLDLAQIKGPARGIDNQPARFQGRSLAAALSGAPLENRLILSQTVDGSAPLYALRWGNHKLIYEHRTHTVRLFDLEADPAERNDLAPHRPLETQALLQALRVGLARHAALLLAAGDRAAAPLDEETIRRLRALGYLR